MLKKYLFPSQNSLKTTLSVFEQGQVPFSIKRVFTVNAAESCSRGFHAHKECAQILVCLTGQCLVTCDDGQNRQSFTLNNPEEGLLIPPSLWAEQEYKPNTILMVLTDHIYDESDYIRDYEAFLKYRNERKNR